MRKAAGRSCHKMAFDHGMRTRMFLALILIGRVTAGGSTRGLRASTTPVASEDGIPASERAFVPAVADECGARGCDGEDRLRFEEWLAQNASHEAHGEHLARTLQTEEAVCSNGIAGIESSDSTVCCDSACSQCGGAGCASSAPAGTECCVGTIRNSAELCSVSGAAPCIINDQETPAPTSNSFCSNGLPGVESANSKYCCDRECPTCGGSGCSSIGGDDAVCCTGAISSSGVLCSVSGSAPCIVDDGTPSPVPAPSTPSPTSDSFCTSSVSGIADADGEYCCSNACSSCGGVGCESFGNGVAECCANAIEDAGVTCADAGVAPCIIGSGPSPAAPSTSPTAVAPLVTASPVDATLPTVAPSITPAPLTPATPAPISSPTSTTSPTPGASPSLVLTLAPTEASPAPGVNSVPSPDYPFSVSSPTPVTTIASSCNDTLPSIRWASGTGVGGRMYMEGSGCGTMTDLYKERTEADGWTPKGPIYILDDDYNISYTPTAVTGKWLLVSELHVTTGAIFYCRGSTVGGDCDELRIQSTGPDDWHEVRGHGGSLYFEHTIVTSWDTPNKQPQETYVGGRSFLNCVSEHEPKVTCEGQAQNEMGECRMDIIDSEMGYMGYFDSESYGLTWKVRGYCVDKSNPEVFDETDVFGDILRSEIHHMYYGMYSYGHQGGTWTDNIMRDNHQYGFDPHDDSDYLTIARNEVYNNVNHGIIASKRCNNVKIFENEVYNGGAQAAGIFLHRSSDSCEVYDNYVHDMNDSGLAIMESFDAEVYDNVFENVRYGVRISLGGGNNLIRDNVFDTCDKYGLYTYKGTDEAEKTDDGRPGENVFMDNEILNTQYGCKIKEADNTVITGNLFTGTEKLYFTNAQATTWYDNEAPGCVRNIVLDNGETVPTSTFTDDTDGLPADC